MSFVHLHVHSHYSMLDGMSKVSDLVDKCLRLGMPAMALTDHGNMYGIKDFLDYVDKVNAKPKKAVSECQEALDKETDEAKKAELAERLIDLKQKEANYKPFKPIVGMEAYCAHEEYADELLEGHRKHRGWHLILLAKNQQGYHNLCQLSSIAFTKGMYGGNARITHKLLEQYHEGLICSSACLAGELPQKIMEGLKTGDLSEAENTIQWFQNLFHDDYYLELQRLKMDGVDYEEVKRQMQAGSISERYNPTCTYPRQQEVNEVLLQLAAKYHIKVIATNDSHFVEQEHAEAHDRLICLSTGKDFDEPDRLRYTKQEWLKSPDEMAALFADVPEALSTTLEIAEKVQVYSLNSDPIMPKFDIPESFGTEEAYRKKLSEQELFDEFTRNEKGEVVLSQEDAEKKIKKLGGYNKLYRIKLEADYLAKLAWEGARRRYGEQLTEEQTERIVFELHIMKTMGFPGYFLIVQDYIRAAREELDVWVGPGRGSAAGSVVAYCLGITDLDPLRYDLLFERFLNPDRISLPDIDVDFEDDGRERVLNWVTQKYGADHVAHIITYGTMASKSAIADVGRVQKVPLTLVNTIKALIPDKSFPDNIKNEKGKSPAVNLSNCFKYVPELQPYLNGNDSNVSSMLHYARDLEDTNRQVGIHACGVIIGADDLKKIAPVCTIKDKASQKDVLVTQYDGHVVESVGLIKMDFLGLKTLSLLKEAVKNVKKVRGEDVDIFKVPVDDELTYKLYQEGRTVGIFQFESPGMRKYLRELKPTKIEDLIAMNALYRPGPMDYIPQFIRRKQGVEPIEYDIPVMKAYLEDTYGVTVYQEQVMLLSRLLANFTRGEADTLRKAMGKKILPMLAKLKPKFLEGGARNGHDTKVLEKIWADWEKFASYAFNKSHAACYAWVSYQTAYMKAHYPAEFMAANLTRSRDSITDVTKFMEECKAMGINVLGPDVNASDLNFVPDKKGDIRFGLGGVKGVGAGAVEAIVNERAAHGEYKDIYDFVERINLNACNRKTLESLAYAGAFDSLGLPREAYFVQSSSGESFLEQLVNYAGRYQSDNSQVMSLFTMDQIQIKKPLPGKVSAWPTLFKLSNEKNYIGLYLSAHPLDEYKSLIEYYCNVSMAELSNPESMAHFSDGDLLHVAGIVTAVREGTDKHNQPFYVVTIEDYSGNYEFFIGSKNIELAKYAKVNYYVMLTGVWSRINPEYGRFQKKSDTKQEDSNAKPMKFWLQKMELLEEKRKNAFRNLTITFSLDNLQMDDIVTISNNIQGDIQETTEDNEDGILVDLYVDVVDQTTKLTINTMSKKKIVLNNKLFDFLKERKAAGILSFAFNLKG